MSSDSATRDIARPAVSRAAADSAVDTDVKLEFPVLNIRVRGCWLAALWLAGGCGSLPASSTTTLAVPGRANANVSMTAKGEFVAAAWSAAEPGGSMDIYLSVSDDGGKRFVAPVRVNATPGEARVNGEQPPRHRSGSARRRTAVESLSSGRPKGPQAPCCWGRGPTTPAGHSARRRSCRAPMRRATAGGTRWGPTPRATSTSCGSITGGLRRIRRPKAPIGMVRWLSQAATPPVWRSSPICTRRCSTTRPLPRR